MKMKMKDIRIRSKRPFRDSNCRYAFRLATTQTGGGSLFACNAGCSPLVKSRSRGRPLPHTSKKVKKYIRSKKEKLSYGNRRLGRLLTLNFHFSIAKLKPTCLFSVNVANSQNTNVPSCIQLPHYYYFLLL